MECYKYDCETNEEAQEVFKAALADGMAYRWWKTNTVVVAHVHLPEWEHRRVDDVTDYDKLMVTIEGV